MPGQRQSDHAVEINISIRDPHVMGNIDGVGSEHHVTLEQIRDSELDPADYLDRVIREQASSLTRSWLDRKRQRAKKVQEASATFAQLLQDLDQDQNQEDR